MLGLKASSRRSNRDEAEKPFWISFSDLMTALMVLFLVAMAVALLSVTQGLRDIKAKEEERVKSVESCMAEVQDVTHAFNGVVIREHSIDFGPKANFANNSSDLSVGQQTFLRQFVPQVLEVATQPSCKRWLKRVVVEGFASQNGTYLHNLDLSTKRSERVLCALLDAKAHPPIEESQRQLIQSLFLVGGYSSNSIRKTPEESRRIELKLEFYDLKDPKEAAPQPIPLDESSSCPI
jgi:outer membrane protein OmpA-like peptidoglycan-associated protein